MELDKRIREHYSPEVEKKYNRRVRNVYFLVRGVNGQDYYIFEGNSGQIICILEIDEESYRFI